MLYIVHTIHYNKYRSFKTRQIFTSLSLQYFKICPFVSSVSFLIPLIWYHGGLLKCQICSAEQRKGFQNTFLKTFNYVKISYVTENWVLPAVGAAAKSQAELAMLFVPMFEIFDYTAIFRLQHACGPLTTSICGHDLLYRFEARTKMIQHNKIYNKRQKNAAKLA